jgi:hypothetical protein
MNIEDILDVSQDLVSGLFRSGAIHGWAGLGESFAGWTTVKLPADEGSRRECYDFFCQGNGQLAILVATPRERAWLPHL